LTERLAKQWIGDKLTDAGDTARLLRLGENRRDEKQDKRNDCSDPLHSIT